MVDAIAALLSEPTLATGISLGLLGLFIVGGVHALARRLTYVGIPLAAAGTTALLASGQASPAMVVGVLVVTVGGAISAKWGAGLVVVGLGGLLIALVTPDLPWWAKVVVSAGIVPIGMAMGSTDRTAVRNLGPLMLAISMLGIALGVPDVEGPLAVLGSLLPVAIVSLSTAWRLGGIGSFPLAGLILVTATTGAPGRPGAVIGSIGALGLLITGALVNRWPWPVAVLAHGGWVLYSTRVVGLRNSLTQALLLLALGLLIIGLLTTTTRFRSGGSSWRPLSGRRDT